jgi:hypothetical protein
VPGGSTELLLVDAAARRRRLDDRHEQSDGVWLVLAKKGTAEPTGLPAGIAEVERARSDGRRGARG